MRRGPAARGRVSLAAREAPLNISGLAAWYDSRDDDYITLATGISAWVSRAGSLGTATLSQGTAANQPAYETSVATLGSRPAVFFDGSNDALAAATASTWAFLSNGTGATIFLVERIDSTGGATQVPVMTMTAVATNVGIYAGLTTTALQGRVGNGSGTYCNNWGLTTASHYARDASRWRALTYEDETMGSRVSGSSLTNADTAAQEPSASNPTLALTVGGSAGLFFKGWLAQIIIYNRVLTTAEFSALASWANQQYGVTV